MWYRMIYFLIAGCGEGALAERRDCISFLTLGDAEFVILAIGTICLGFEHIHKSYLSFAYWRK